jgi:hypothetical protein
MLRRVALVRTDVSEAPGASLIRVARLGELGTTQSATSNRRTLVFLYGVHRLLVADCVVPSSPILATLIKEAPGSSEMSVFTGATHSVTSQKTPFFIINSTWIRQVACSSAVAGAIRYFPKGHRFETRRGE